MRDDSTIHIKKDKTRKYRFSLIADSNGKCVGQCVRGYAELFDLYQDLELLRNGFIFNSYTSKSGKHWFRGQDIPTDRILIRSQGYTRKIDRANGEVACGKAIESARVALLFSENTDVWDLYALLKNPTLGIVQT